MTIQAKGFREKETARLFAWAAAGESVSIIGMSGVGKSNLFNHLQDVKMQEKHLGKAAAHTIIIRVNFHYLPDFDDRSILSLILEQLETLDDKGQRLGITTEQLAQISHYHEALLDAGDDTLKVQRYFKLAIHTLLADPAKRLVLLFDQFDKAYQETEPHFFTNLRGLRETYKYRLSYLVFTRDLLAHMAPLDTYREEFHELLTSNQMGLQPYDESDSRHMVARIARRRQLEVTESLSGRFYQLTGGHAGLMRAVFLAVLQDGVALADSDDQAAAALSPYHTIAGECEKIWRSLSTDERRTLAFTIAKLSYDTRPSVAQALRLKGLLKGESETFSPIFAHFVQRQEKLWERPLHFDETTRQIVVLGRTTGHLTKREFHLFKLLWDNTNQLVNKDELIEAGWPGTKGGVSDEALIAAMSRLRRKIEPEANSEEPRFLQNVRGHGYILKSE